jgi:phospholipid/cholesterol/gamma-HCH transport system substrate-binding protein
MLSDRTRNTIVGLTILAGLAVGLAGLSMLKQFPNYFRPKPYEVRIDAPNAAGIGIGAHVNLNGATIGSVKSVRLVNRPATAPVAGKPPGMAGALSTEPASLPSVYVEIVAAIDVSYDIPRGTAASVGGQGLSFAGPVVSLTAPAQPAPDMLPKDGTAAIQAGLSDSGLLPKDVFEDIHTLKEDLSVLSKELTTVAKDLHTMLIYTPLEGLEKYKPGDPRRPQDNISTLVLKLNITVDSINKILNDPDLPGNVHTVVANLVTASADIKDVLASIKTTMGTADTSLGKFGAASENISTAAKDASKTLAVAEVRLNDVSEHLVVTLRTLDDAVNAIAKGEGTAGKLIRDPKLYDGLVDLTHSLSATVEEVNKLVHQWKQDGIPLRVGPK